MNKVRNILLISSSGNGKSALANVLTQSEEFKENSQPISETKSIKSKEFEHNGIKYKVIDTVGLDDTQLKDKEVLQELNKVASELNGEINQIFFLIKNKLNKKEIESYKLLGEVLFDKDIYSYTTLIKTSFPEFENEEECQETTKILKAETQEIKELVENCNGIIYI